MIKIEEFKKKYKTIIEYAYQTDCEMLNKQGIKEYYEDLQSLIQQAVEEQKEKDAKIVESNIMGSKTKSVWEWDDDRRFEAIAKSIREQ